MTNSQTRRTGIFVVIIEILFNRGANLQNSNGKLIVGASQSHDVKSIHPLRDFWDWHSVLDHPKRPGFCCDDEKEKKGREPEYDRDECS